VGVVLSNLISRAKALRKRPTDAEQLLWKYLRLKQLAGLKFRRQVPIDGYIVDFVCYETKVVIEADGGQHDQCEADAERDAFLRSQGFVVLRFWNTDILNNIRGVLTEIQFACRERHPPLNPLPSREGKMQNSECDS